jgi:hypothetical protein
MRREPQTVSKRLGHSRGYAVMLLCACLLGAVRGDVVCVLAERPPAGMPIAAPVCYWHESRTSPRPLEIHILRIDLGSGAIEPDAAISEDPDGEGPAEAQLEDPAVLALHERLLAAVNANAFGQTPPGPDDKPRWTRHLPVDIVGWAKSRSREASRPHSGNFSLWVDPEGHGHTGNLSKSVPARIAVAGFSGLVREGRLLDTTEAPLHPRTAAGVDREGRILWLVVVDGRQKGYSEGMSTGELAVLMKDLGCDGAINVDGGGSSIMLLAAGDGPLRVMNRPSDPSTRPVPVMIGVRLRQPAPGVELNHGTEHVP